MTVIYGTIEQKAVAQLARFLETSLANSNLVVVLTNSTLQSIVNCSNIIMSDAWVWALAGSLDNRHAHSHRNDPR